MVVLACCVLSTREKWDRYPYSRMVFHALGRRDLHKLPSEMERRLSSFGRVHNGKRGAFEVAESEAPAEAGS